ncbi:hypothetical protein [Methanopyrus kandleri]
MVPDPEGIPVTEGSTFLEGDPLSEGAHVLLGGYVRILRHRGPVVLNPFETARESIVSVRWIEGMTSYEYTDRTVHDWDRMFRPAFLLPALVSCVRRCG